MSGADVGAGAASDAATDSGTAGGDGAATQVEQFLEELARASCAWQFSCCSPPEIDLLGGGGYLTESDCRWYTQLTLGARFVEVNAAAAAGHLSLDPALARACLDTFETGHCAVPGQASDLWSILGGCHDPFVGHVAAGGRCFISNECAPGSQCLTPTSFDDGAIPLTSQGLSAVRSLSPGSAFVGLCVPYIEKGDKCRNSFECAPAHYCRRPEFVCAAPAGELEECNVQVDPNGYPNVLIACDDATRSLACGDGLCRRPPRNSEPCAQNGNFVCDPDPNLALTCVGAGFNGPGICKLPGLSGAACGPEGLPPCAQGFACLPVDDLEEGIGVCGALPKQGAVCALGLRCAPPAVCHLLSGTCMVPGTAPDSQPCTFDEDCVSLTCRTNGSGDEGVCAPSDISPACAGSGNSPVSGATVKPPSQFRFTRR